MDWQWSLSRLTPLLDLLGREAGAGLRSSRPNGNHPLVDDVGGEGGLSLGGSDGGEGGSEGGFDGGIGARVTQDWDQEEPPGRGGPVDIGAGVLARPKWRVSTGALRTEVTVAYATGTLDQEEQKENAGEDSQADPEGRRAGQEDRHVDNEENVIVRVLKEGRAEAECYRAGELI